MQHIQHAPLGHSPNSHGAGSHTHLTLPCLETPPVSTQIETKQKTLRTPQSDPLPLLFHVMYPSLSPSLILFIVNWSLHCLMHLSIHSPSCYLSYHTFFMCPLNMKGFRKSVHGFWWMIPPTCIHADINVQPWPKPPPHSR